MRDDQPITRPTITAQQLREIATAVSEAVTDDHEWRAQVLTGIKVLEVRFDSFETQFNEHKVEDRQNVRDLNQTVSQNTVSIAKIMTVGALCAALMAVVVWGLNRAFPVQSGYAAPTQQRSP